MTDPRPYIEIVDEAGSTNTLLAARAASLPHGAVIAARAQTHGRGQRGNSWEAAPGCNLTFSQLLRPASIRPAESFILSMIVSLAIAETLQEFLPAGEVAIKWPNDIYVGDSKICGILIENSFCGSDFQHSVVGIGININQEAFLSDAPNPISLYQLTGRRYQLDEMLNLFARNILIRFDSYEQSPDPAQLSAQYHARLWRRSGKYDWMDHVAGERVHAAIESVALSGHLTLGTCPPRTYAFKEISPL